MKAERDLQRFLTRIQIAFEVAKGPCIVNGAVAEFGQDTGLALGVPWIRTKED